jgi:uncharacterized membrane protein YdbT with pleckstrin-like domain
MRTSAYRLPAVDLQSGEKVIYQGHPSWRAILAFYLKGIVIALIVGVIVKLADDTAMAVLAFAVIVGITVVGGFVVRIATTYTITDRRLNIKKGIVARKVQETRLQRVQNVNYTQSVFQRLLQVGDVDFDTAGTDDSGFVFAGVAQPEQIVEKVDRETHGDAGLEEHRA